MADEQMIQDFFDSIPPVPQAATIQATEGDEVNHNSEVLPITEGQDVRTVVSNVEQELVNDAPVGQPVPPPEIWGPRQETNERMEQSENWHGPLTGSNMLPLGKKSEVTSRRDSHPPPPVIKVESRSDEYVSAAKIVLELQPQRYLPPPGRYFDELSLTKIFGAGFFDNRKCLTCWGRSHPLAKGGECQNTCPICETQDHPDGICTLLYCTADWYHELKWECRLAVASRSQIRPSVVETHILEDMGLLHISDDDRDFIIPNYCHQLVRDFYYRKLPPQPERHKPSPSKPRYEANSSRGMNGQMLRGDTFAPFLQTWRPVMNDERASSTPVQNGNRISVGSPGLTVPISIDQESYLQSPIESFVSSSNFYGGAELRIQELEEEVLSLRAELVAKDREIRKLRFEAQNFGTLEVGQKRQRFSDAVGSIHTLSSTSFMEQKKNTGRRQQ